MCRLSRAEDLDTLSPNHPSTNFSPRRFPIHSLIRSLLARVPHSTSLLSIPVGLQITWTNTSSLLEDNPGWSSIQIYLNFYSIIIPSCLCALTVLLCSVYSFVPCSWVRTSCSVLSCVNVASNFVVSNLLFSSLHLPLAFLLCL